MFNSTGKKLIHDRYINNIYTNSVLQSVCVDIFLSLQYKNTNRNKDNESSR